MLNSSASSNKDKTDRSNSPALEGIFVNLSSHNQSKTYIRSKIIKPHSKKYTQKQSNLQDSLPYDQISQKKALQKKACEFIKKIQRQKQEYQGRFFKERQRQQKKRKYQQAKQKEIAQKEKQLRIMQRLKSPTIIFQNQSRVKLQLIKKKNDQQSDKSQKPISINLPRLTIKSQLPLTNLVENSYVLTNQRTKKRYLMKKYQPDSERQYMTVSLEQIKCAKKYHNKLHKKIRQNRHASITISNREEQQNIIDQQSNTNMQQGQKL